MNSRGLSSLLSREFSRVLSNPDGLGGGVSFSPDSTGLISLPDNFGNTLRWRSLVLAQDNYLRAAPYSIGFNLSVSPDDTVVTNQASLNAGANSNWVDGVKAGNNSTYFAANKALGNLKLDTTTPVPGQSMAPPYGVSVFTRGMDLGSDGILYTSFYDGTNRISRVNPATDTGEATIPITADDSGPFYTQNPGVDASGFHRYDWGITCTPDGKVFVCPYGSERVSYFVIGQPNGFQSPTALNGGREVPSGLTGDPSSDPYFRKYSGRGQYVDRTGLPTNPGKWIYWMPRTAHCILKQDTEAPYNSYEIPLPSTLTEETTGLFDVLIDENKSMSSVMGSDGYIYSTPWALPWIFRINPANDAISFFYIGDIMADQTVKIDGVDNGGNGFWTYGAARGDSIYYACGGARKLFRMNLVVIPDAPTSLSATAGDTEVSLSWVAPANASGTISYRIFESGVLIRTVSGLSYIHSGLANDTTYSYTVRAFNSEGESLDSNTAVATPTGGGGVGAAITYNGDPVTYNGAAVTYTT